MKRFSGFVLLAAIACCLPGCYTKTISRSGGFGPQTGTVHEPDAPDNALEDAADVIYPRDWKQKKNPN
jgi:hypothetical protein